MLRNEAFPWIIGYKPLGNYQQLLGEVVVSRLDDLRYLEELALALVDRRATVPDAQEIAFELAPRAEQPGLYIRDSSQLPVRQYAGRRIDYFEREARNRSLGAAGEEVVVEIERRRLVRERAERLADRVEWVAQTRGDGLGFDVLSFERNGQERFIEVKTTTFGKETPFYVSRNEVSFSSKERDQYQLYRLFEFREAPRLYRLKGAIEENCRLEATAFAASVK